jgi:parallel beta-helix repeat protein
MRQTGFVLLTLLATVTLATATVLHVPSEYPTIQTGINAAVDGDTVLVADGTYTGNGNRDIDFYGKAIVVVSENGPEATIIDCEGDSLDPHRGFYFHSGEDSTSVVQGFTIMNGWATLYGGGVYCNESSPTIENNIILRNTAVHNGAGIYCNMNSCAIITGNAITGNTAYLSGGGILCSWNYYSYPTIVGNEFTENQAEKGGAVFCEYTPPPIVDNWIEGNTSKEGGGIYFGESTFSNIEGNTIMGNTADYGGGIYGTINGNWTLDGNTITGNTAYLDGGGIYLDCHSPLVGNRIVGNTAWRDGGGVHCGASPSIIGNVIAENEACWYGGGINCYTSSSPLIVENTVTQNRALYGGGINCWDHCSPFVLNSIVWGDSSEVGDEIFRDPTSSVYVTYSDIGGGWPGEGNIDLDPLFAFSTYDDNPFMPPEDLNYHLLWGSPCIDAGHPDSLDPDGTRKDMGALYYDQLTRYSTEPLR